MVQLSAVGHERIGNLRQALALAAGHLQGLSPLAVLERGYALAHLAETGELLRDAEQTTIGRLVNLRLHRGSLDLRVVKRFPQGGKD